MNQSLQAKVTTYERAVRLFVSSVTLIAWKDFETTCHAGMFMRRVQDSESLGQGHYLQESTILVRMQRRI